MRQEKEQWEIDHLRKQQTKRRERKQRKPSKSSSGRKSPNRSSRLSPPKPKHANNMVTGVSQSTPSKSRTLVPGIHMKSPPMSLTILNRYDSDAEDDFIVREKKNMPVVSALEVEDEDEKPLGLIYSKA